ncbi:peptidase [Arthrobacter phage Mendel]|uniref:Lysin A, M23 peptidase domain n=1 Tax=Arthrobacter phage Mendel TaxID=2484218 RepID=A0A3G3M0S2_9CAUD|nr:peptidase [Arthrobacter phage Mendel]AYQ99931.1 lysin A, M23 peptidase domain [Arthrobacter phage Mendel]
MVSMPIEYNIRYVEALGDMVRLHYTDGKKVLAFPDGKGRFKPGTVDPGPPPETYTPPTPPDPELPPSSGDWDHPLPGAVFTSGFGMRTGGFHYGIDLSTTTAPSGGNVHAPTDLVITVAVDAFEGGNWSGGTHVKGHTLDGAYTFAFYHMADESLAVSVGSTITKGTVLGVEGATGNVTGTHLHFEISVGSHDNPWPPPYNNGVQFVDPLPILRSHGVNI